MINNNIIWDTFCFQQFLSSDIGRRRSESSLDNTFIMKLGSLKLIIVRYRWGFVLKHTTFDIFFFIMTPVEY